MTGQEEWWPAPELGLVGRCVVRPVSNGLLRVFWFCDERITPGRDPDVWWVGAAVMFIAHTRLWRTAHRMGVA